MFGRGLERFGEVPTSQNLPKPSQTFPNLSQTSQNLSEPLRTSQNLSEPIKTYQKPIKTFANPKGLVEKKIIDQNFRAVKPFEGRAVKPFE